MSLCYFVYDISLLEQIAPEKMCSMSDHKQDDLNAKHVMSIVHCIDYRPRIMYMHTC